MKIGFVGLGKLGLPVATAMALRGADVMGNDLDPARMTYGPHPWIEKGPDGTGDFNKVLHMNVGGGLRFGTLAEVVAHAGILFVAVQTPHDPRFGGERPVVDAPVDFDYSYLVSAIRHIVSVKPNRNPLPLVVISTVLPGTMRREVMPFLEGTGLQLVYNPHFIAMGTTMRDFLNPEFILLGGDDSNVVRFVRNFYSEVLGPDFEAHRMSIESAELTKVAYNTYISTKIAVANTLMEICHKTPGANVDEVTRALQSAHTRVASGMYMRGGMGDGGGCHPRDNIALGYLAKKLELAYDPFTAAMRAREDQSAWLAVLVSEAMQANDIDYVCIAGLAFKPGTNITTGSPALLLVEQLKSGLWIREFAMFDPYVYPGECAFPLRLKRKAVVVIGCNHSEFIGWDAGKDLASGSVVIDPHRIVVSSNPSVRVKHVGVGALNARSERVRREVA